MKKFTKKKNLRKMKEMRGNGRKIWFLYEKQNKTPVE